MATPRENTHRKTPGWEYWTMKGFPGNGIMVVEPEVVYLQHPCVCRSGIVRDVGENVESVT